MNQPYTQEVRNEVRANYAKIALSNKSGCGGSPTSCCSTANEANLADALLALGYSPEEISAVPAGANMGLGCGNPQAIASLKSGETVLDLGSGGGFDCFLAVQAVGERGHVIGVDMTPEMIAKARQNLQKSKSDKVEFRLGEIENLPVADGIVDVIISNCVINLSPEKEKVFKEAYRVLRPGGRLAISDMVAIAELPEKLKEDMALYTGCMTGAALVADLRSTLIRIGFEEIQIKSKDESKDFITGWVPPNKIENYVISATIQGKKPGIPKAFS